MSTQDHCALDRAAGHVEGKRYFRCGLTPPLHLKVGFDAYALGFRAGYYLQFRLLNQAGIAGFMNRKG